MTDTPEVDITDVLKLAISRGERADGYARIGVVDAERALFEITRLRRELDAARKALNSSIGYMLNAKIDLETGVPKQTAIQTIEGGLKMVRTALGETSNG